MAQKTPPARRPARGRTSVKPAAAKAKAESKIFPALKTAYMATAHGLGGLIRAFSTEKLAPEDRRDGAPFFVFLLSIFGVLFSWFLINEPIARFLHTYSFGMLFGLVAFALPAVFFVYSFYLFRHPASVRDSSRFAVGFWLSLSVIAAFFHVFNSRPTPNQDQAEGLAAAGGLFGWLVGEPAVSLLTIWGAVPLLLLLFLVSVLIMRDPS